MKVYAYGAKAPIHNMEATIEQMRLAARYQNDLVAIERRRREERDVYMATVVPPALVAKEAELSAAIDEMRASIKKVSASQRAKVKADPEQKAALAEMRAELKHVKADLREARAKARELEQPGGPLDVIQESAYQAIRDARGACGVFWGTYLMVERAVDAARKKPTAPRFHRWDGGGQVAVQLQGHVEGYHRAGLPVSHLDGRDSRLQVLSLSQVSWRPGGPAPNLDNWRLMRIRIGSEGRAPIWAEAPVKWHRDLPRQAVVTWASLHRKRTGLSYHWEAQFTLDDPATAVQSPLRPEQVPVYATAVSELPGPGEICAIDIGWRVVPDGLRTALLVSESGQMSELRLSDHILGQLTRPDGIQAVQDDCLNAILARLAQWLKGRDVPEWLAEETEHVSQWKSPRRLVRLIGRWKAERTAGDEEIWPALEKWLATSKHLMFGHHLRARGQRARKNLYRLWAAEVCRRFRVVIIEAFDLRKLARLAPPEGEQELHAVARRNRTLACVSSLREALQQAAAKTGTEVREVECAYTSQACTACGHIEPIPDSLLVQCSACGVTMDQDYRAACNLLASALGRWRSPVALAGQ